MPLSHTPDNQLQHGYYQIERLDTLLRLTIAEGINRELVLQYQKDVARHVGSPCAANAGGCISSSTAMY